VTTFFDVATLIGGVLVARGHTGLSRPFGVIGDTGLPGCPRTNILRGVLRRLVHAMPLSCSTDDAEMYPTWRIR
jgi:hypothetical protein